MKTRVIVHEDHIDIEKLYTVRDDDGNVTGVVWAVVKCYDRIRPDDFFKLYRKYWKMRGLKHEVQLRRKS